MSTDRYTPDELAFLDTALVGIANGYLSDPAVVALNAEHVAKDALRLLDARRKIRGSAQPTPEATIANDELATHQFVCNENVIRGAFFWRGMLTDTRGGISFNGSTMGFEYIPTHLALSPNDIVEIRVLERADR